MFASSLLTYPSGLAAATSRLRCGVSMTAARIRSQLSVNAPALFSV